MSRPAVLVDPDWNEAAVDVIRFLAFTQETVTAEDLRRDFEAPENANQIGSAFRSAYSRRIITPVGYRQSRDKSRRGGALRVWALHPSMKENHVDDHPHTH